VSLGEGLDGRLSEIGIRLDQELQRRPATRARRFEQLDDPGKAAEKACLSISRDELCPWEDELGVMHHPECGAGLDPLVQSLSADAEEHRSLCQRQASTGLLQERGADAGEPIRIGRGGRRLDGVDFGQQVRREPELIGDKVEMPGQLGTCSVSIMPEQPQQLGLRGSQLCKKHERLGRQALRAPGRLP